jgi:hypothetical protein
VALADNTRFPDELIPHEAARRLLRKLGVQIVAGDAELIAEAQAAAFRRWAAEAAERDRIRDELAREREERSRQAAAERTEHMPYRRRA